MGYQPYMRDLPEADYVAVQNQSERPSSSGILKRGTDIIIALIAVIFFAPALLVIALIVRFSDGGPAVFRQDRIGRDGKAFTCYKFRSMNVNAKEQLERLLKNDPKARAAWQATQKLEHDPRITPLGRFLRKSSLDELPQLLNVLKGEMSIVGPRPIIENEIVRYKDSFEDYCQVRPGLTGLWQVSGRSETSYEERVALDVAYVRNQSYLEDWRIILMTIPAVLFSSGAK